MLAEKTAHLFDMRIRVGLMGFDVLDTGPDGGRASRSERSSQKSSPLNGDD